MKLNAGCNLTRLFKDLAKGRVKKLSNYVWVTVSQRLK